MSCEKHAVLGLWPRILWRIVRRICEEFLNAVDLAMEQRRKSFIIGGDCMCLKVRSAQDGRAKELAAGPDARTGEWDDGGFGGGEYGAEELGRLGIRGHDRFL